MVSGAEAREASKGALARDASRGGIMLPNHKPPPEGKLGRHRPADRLLAFLKGS